MSKKNTIEANANRSRKIFAYIVLIFLTVLCLVWFYLLFLSATQSTAELTTSFKFTFGSHLVENFKNALNKTDLFRGLLNSVIISGACAILTTYFSTLTAYAVVVYDWKLKNAFFSFVMAVMMIPAQVTMIGFYQMAYKLGLTNSLLMLILPSVAAPSMVFFMRQYMIPSLPLEIVQAARIDGAKEFYTFNIIALPIMKPAIATQAIFSFVSSWNNLFTPMVLLTKQEKYTMPIMVSLLKGDIYKTEYGAVYMGLTLTVLPLIIVYLFLAKYIVAGVALGSVKG